MLHFPLSGTLQGSLTSWTVLPPTPALASIISQCLLGLSSLKLKPLRWGKCRGGGKVPLDKRWWTGEEPSELHHILGSLQTALSKCKSPSQSIQQRILSLKPDSQIESKCEDNGLNRGVCTTHNTQQNFKVSSLVPLEMVFCSNMNWQCYGHFKSILLWNCVGAWRNSCRWEEWKKNE